jgi:hypothetical protein
MKIIKAGWRDALKNHLVPTKKKVILVVLSICGIFIFLVLMSLLLVVLEAYNKKELIPCLSSGDCRIVNISKSLKLKDASIIVHKTKAGTTHVIAIDSNDTVHDLSKGGEKNNGISYVQYKANHFDENIYTAVLKNKNIVSSSMKYNSFIKTYLYKFYVYVSIFTIKLKDNKCQ